MVQSRMRSDTKRLFVNGLPVKIFSDVIFVLFSIHSKTSDPHWEMLNIFHLFDDNRNLYDPIQLTYIAFPCCVKLENFSSANNTTCSVYHSCTLGRRFAAAFKFFLVFHLRHFPPSLVGKTFKVVYFRKKVSSCLQTLSSVPSSSFSTFFGR